MASDRSIRRYRRWYARLLRLYPRPFQDRFGEPMAQTFTDLIGERRDANRGLHVFALGTFVETGDGEPEVAEPELQVVGDPARRLAIHAMQADDDRTAVEPRLVGVEMWGVDDRQLEVSGVEVDGTVEVGDVDVDEADREHWHGRHLLMLAVFVLPNVA